MTRNSPTGWTRLDLELYRDDALDAATCARLTESLRQSPELRERLTGVAKLDALARAALLHGAIPAPLPPVRWTPVAAAAAILALAIGLALLYPRVESTERVPETAPIPGAPAPMVVWSFPVRAGPTIAPTRGEPIRENQPDAATPVADALAHEGAAPTMTAAQFGRQLDAALARSDAAAAAELLATSDEALRIEGYRRLGAVLRSLSTARRVLEELPVGEQLAACRELAVEPRWRTVAVTRLTTLHDDPANRAAVEALLAELARSPELAPLVRRIRSSTARGAGADRSI